MSDFDFFKDTKTGKRLKSIAKTRENLPRDLTLRVEEQFKRYSEFRQELARDLVELYSKRNTSDDDFFKYPGGEPVAAEIDKESDKENQTQSVLRVLEQNAERIAGDIAMWTYYYYKREVE